MKIKNLYKKIKTFGLISSSIILIGTVLIFAQKENMQTRSNQDSDKFDGGFRRLSSTETDRDKGNKIVAVRRINVIVEDTDSDGNFVNRGIAMVEIELYSNVAPPITNAAHIVRIGDKEFVPGNIACSGNRSCVSVEISEKEFDELQDGGLITYRIGSPISPKVLKELYKDGEPKEVVGAKFGRLDKKMIDKFPTVERNAVQN